MPTRRPPREVWTARRLQVLERDGWKCVRCQLVVTVSTAHIDHIQSGKRAGNERGNLRVLCRRCHVLRADRRHRGMIAAALRDGVIDADWRSQVWTDEELLAGMGEA